MSSTILPGGPFYYHFEGKRDRPIIEFDQYGYFYNPGNWTDFEHGNRQRVGPKDDVPIVCDFDDSTIAIGRPDRLNEVRVYEYVKLSNTWSSPTVLSNPGTTSSEFGYALSMNWDGDRLAVGSPGDNKVYVYDKDTSTGSWSYYSNVITGSTTSGVEFGSSVSIAQESGDTICIGAPGSATGGTSVFVYEYDSINCVWSQTFSNTSVDVDVLVPYDATQNITMNNNLSRYGHSVSMSLNGEHFAVGAPGSQEITDIDQTTAQIQAATTTTTTTTTQASFSSPQSGRDITASQSWMRWFGFSMSISGDGNRIVGGAPYTTQSSGGGGQRGMVEVYDWNGSSWSIKGSTIFGTTNDQYGYSVALSRDGTRWIAGGRYITDPNRSGYRTGAIRVYEWISNAWAQVGQTLYGENIDDRFGEDVAISADGTRIAIGAPYNNGTGTRSGHVRVYDWNSGTSVWTQVGNDIDGEAAYDYSGGNDWIGRQLCMSDNGLRVAIGAHRNHSGSSSDSGHVRVYEESNNLWSQLGGDIDGVATNDYFGSCVAMDANGVRIAVGAEGVDYNGISNAGQVRVYQYNAAKTVANANGPIGWDKIGQDINGTNSKKMSTVALSSDGTRLAVGHVDGGSSQNPAYLYDWNTSTNSWDLFQQATPGYSSTNNDWGASLALSSDGNRFAVGAPTYYTGEIGVFDNIGAATITTTTTTPPSFLGTNVLLSATPNSWENTIPSGLYYLYRQYNYLPSGGNYAGNVPNNTTYDPNGLPGFARVFTRGTHSTWQGYGVQLGQVMRGNEVWTLTEQTSTTRDQSWGWSRCGWKVALCKSDATSSYTDSLRLIVSSPGQPGVNKTLGNSAQSGAVDTYSYDTLSGAWVNQSTLYGDHRRDEYGHSISLDYTGNRLAISTKGQLLSTHFLTPGYRIDTSKVSVLEWNNDKWWEATPTIYLNGSSFPNSGANLGRNAFDSLNVTLTNGKHVFITSPLYGNVFTQHVTLTQNFIGNSLFEGYVAANKYYVGANEADGNSTNTKGSKVIEFGGFYGDAVYELTSIENRVYDSYDNSESFMLLGRTEMLLSKLSQQQGIDAIRAVTQEFLVGTAPTTIGGSVIRRKEIGTSGITYGQSTTATDAPTTSWTNLGDWYENFEYDKYDRDTSSFGVDSRGNVVINPAYRRPSIVWRGYNNYYPGLVWPYPLSAYPDFSNFSGLMAGQIGPDIEVDPGTFYGNAKLDVRGNALIRDRLVVGDDKSNMMAGWGREPAGLHINTTNADNVDFSSVPFKFYLEDFYTSRDDSQTKLRTDYGTIHKNLLFSDRDGCFNCRDTTYNNSSTNQSAYNARSGYLECILAQGSNNANQKTGISFWMRLGRASRSALSSNSSGIYRINTSGNGTNGQWISGTAGILWATERVLCTWGENSVGAAEYGGTASNRPGFWIWIDWRDYMYSVTNTAPYGFAFAPHKRDGTYGNYNDWVIDDNWHHVVIELPGGSSTNNPIVPTASNTAMYWDGSGPHALDSTSITGGTQTVYWDHGTRVRLFAEHFAMTWVDIANFRLYISWARPKKTPNALELYNEGSPATRIICKGIGEFESGVKVGGTGGILLRTGDLDPVTNVRQWHVSMLTDYYSGLRINTGIGRQIIFTESAGISASGARVYTTHMRIFPTGNIAIGSNTAPVEKLKVNGRIVGTSYGVSSDDRIKYNESDITDPLALINQLKPQKYEKFTDTSDVVGTWIPTDEEWENVKDKHKYSLEFGFIAQDVRKIPELAFLVSGEETKIVETDISPDEYDQLDSVDQDKCVPFYIHDEPNNDEQDETRINSEVYTNLNPEVQKKFTLKYTTPVETQTTLSLDYTGLSVLTTAGLQKVDAQLQITKIDLQTTKEDVRIIKEELQTTKTGLQTTKEDVRIIKEELQIEKDKITVLETDLDREKLKTTNLQERILVMEQAYYAMLERVSDLENN